ncbi:MAG: hypothetical protein Q8O57_10410, partial [Kiritimatiellota bacterium]|nr:hypothetical protein [Kiritimatiellota bacterium]
SGNIVSNCAFYNNYGSCYGGGAYIDEGLMTDCIVSNNSAALGGGGVKPGGVLRNSVIVNNNTIGGGTLGGGVLMDSAGSMRILIHTGHRF